MYQFIWISSRKPEEAKIYLERWIQKKESGSFSVNTMEPLPWKLHKSKTCFIRRIISNTDPEWRQYYITFESTKIKNSLKKVSKNMISAYFEDLDEKVLSVENFKASPKEYSEIINTYGKSLEFRNIEGALMKKRRLNNNEVESKQIIVILDKEDSTNILHLKSDPDNDYSWASTKALQIFFPINEEWIMIRKIPRLPIVSLYITCTKSSDKIEIIDLYITDYHGDLIYSDPWVFKNPTSLKKAFLILKKKKVIVYDWNQTLQVIL